MAERQKSCGLKTSLVFLNPCGCPRHDGELFQAWRSKHAASQGVQPLASWPQRARARLRGLLSSGAALQYGFLSSITMEMVTNGVGLLTRFLGACSPSRRDSVQRPRCSRQRARGCPCLSPCPRALGDRSPPCPRTPWQGEGRLGLHKLGPSSSLPSVRELMGRCRWHKEICHTKGQTGTAPPTPRLTCHVTRVQPRWTPPKFTPFSPKSPGWGQDLGGRILEEVHMHPWYGALSQGKG